MKNLALIICLFATLQSTAQSVTGYWYGQANVDMAGIHNNYLTELIIAQKGNKVRGFFGYYFKDVYQSFLVKGTYDPQTRKIVIRDIPIIYFNTNSTVNSVDCITSFYGTLMVSRVKTTLYGYFYRDKKYTYTCPDLRVNYTLFSEEKLKDSDLNTMVAQTMYWHPQPNDIVADGSVAGNNQELQQEVAFKAARDRKDEKDRAGDNDEENDPAKKAARNKHTSANKDSATPNSQSGNTDDMTNPSAASQNKDAADSSDENRKDPARPIKKVNTANVQTARVNQNNTAATQPSDIIKIKQQFKERKALLGQMLEVGSDSVRLSFYDNAEVDGDSISVFVNSQLIIAHQELSARALNIYVKLDSLREINEVSMFAENLGKYPPNTALMIVNDGDKRYEVFMSSDLKGNATVRFKRKKPAQ